MNNVVPIPVPFYRGRITLWDLRSFPEGTFLISNVLDGDFPAIGVTVTDEARDRIFAQIKAMRLQGRLFYAFGSRQDYERWRRTHRRLRWAS